MHRALVERAVEGDGAAFEALARSVGDTCMSIATKILRDVDMAEDAVQAALITAWRELGSLRDAASFEPWLHRILVNSCYREARQHQRWSLSLRVLPAETFHASDEALSVADRDQLERAFRRLTIEQRTVLVFHHYLDLPVSEVAERVGVPIGTAKSRLHHATSALRASLAADARTPETQERSA